MNYADSADEASSRQQQAIDVALANRKPPAALSAVCLNGDCGEPSRPGTSYCCPECREDAEKWQRATQQKAVG
ncbi:hypothetical protein [Erwinia sp. Leaf53]|uniref:hypothetical protein n=1 Tax=Erwinia sp. Leaf53 TaxID=1736225 RepID=UPI0006F8E9D9|nr:hypothetical protein [Erwinia sp. Leaf53]KQN63664.1 hypothetical protein ASF13_18995 [Erwinia sp. Leaf53]